MRSRVADPAETKRRNYDPNTGECDSDPVYVDSITFTCGEADRFGKCLITAHQDGVEVHTDRRDPYRQYDRAAVASAVVEKTGGYDADILPLGEKLLEAAKKSPEELALIEFRRITCHELATGDYSLDYLIDGMLVDLQPMIVAGPKKALKTSVLVDLGLSLATGGHFLGYFRILRCCRVAMMSGESGLATLQETARRICHAAGRELADVNGLIFSDQLPHLGDAAHLHGLKEFLKGDEIEVLILDPAYLCLDSDGNEGNLFLMGARLRTISELCAECGCTLILAHHTKKNLSDPYGVPELDGIAWSGFSEFARQWLLLGRREQYQPGTGTHRLWLAAGGSAGHGGLWGLNVDEGIQPNRHWNVEVLKAEEVRQAVEEGKEKAKDEKQRGQVEGAMKRICNALAKFPKGETEKVIKDTAGVSGTIARLAFSELLSTGAIVPASITKGKRKSPYQGYKLAPDSKE